MYSIIEEIIDSHKQRGLCTEDYYREEDGRIFVCQLPAGHTEKHESLVSIKSDRWGDIEIYIEW